MTKVTLERSDYESAYIQAHQILLKVAQNLNEEQGLPLQPLKAAAQLLIQALEADDNRVEAYVLLGSIFLSLEKRHLADKYLARAQQIDPNFQPLIELNLFLSSPESLKKKKKKVQKVAAEAISRVGKFGKTKPEGTVSQALPQLTRLFKPIMPLFKDAEDLKQWIESAFDCQLEPQIAQHLFLLIIGQGPGSTKEQVHALKGILSEIHADFGTHPQRLASAMIQSSQGIARQLHLLLNPYTTQFPNAKDFYNVIQTGFDVQIRKEHAEAFYQLMHHSDFRDAKEQVQTIKRVLDKLFPGSGKELDITPFLEKIADYNQAGAPTLSQHPLIFLKQVGLPLLQECESPRDLYFCIRTKLKLDLSKEKVQGLFHILQGKSIDGSQDFQKSELGKLQHLLVELGASHKQALTVEYGQSLGAETRSALECLVKKLSA